jgi:hypothetical protein
LVDADALITAGYEALEVFCATKVKDDCSQQRRPKYSVMVE